MAINWVNQGNASNDADNFETIYGVATASIARQLVSRAISDWNAVIRDFNYDGDNDPATDNTYSLQVFAGGFPFSLRGLTDISATTTTGLPTAGSIVMDDDGGGTGGWFFDQTPLDDAEFTAVANSLEDGTGDAFQASFIDVTTGGTKYHDFYRTIVHEIGHAVGIYLSSAPGLDRLFNMTTDIGDDPNSNTLADRLRTFNGSNGTVTLVTNGGGHI